MFPIVETGVAVTTTARAGGSFVAPLRVPGNARSWCQPFLGSGGGRCGACCLSTRSSARVAEAAPADTRVILATGNSWDVRLRKANRGEDIRPPLKVGRTHTAERVIAGPKGSGSERIKGVFLSTGLSPIAVSEYGYE